MTTYSNKFIADRIARAQRKLNHYRKDNPIWGFTLSK
jgi:hypothetical protein